MAFQINTPSSASSNAAQGARADANTNNPNWRADAFLNAWIDLPGGKSIKLGAMTYKLSKKVEAQLIEMLSQPGAVDNLKRFVRFDFQLANQPDTGAANMFAFLAAAPAQAENSVPTPAVNAEQEPSAPWDEQAQA